LKEIPLSENDKLQSDGIVMKLRPKERGIESGLKVSIDP